MYRGRYGPGATGEWPNIPPICPLFSRGPETFCLPWLYACEGPAPTPGLQAIKLIALFAVFSSRELCDAICRLSLSSTSPFVKPMEQLALAAGSPTRQALMPHPLAPRRLAPLAFRFCASRAHLQAAVNARRRNCGTCICGLMPGPREWLGAAAGAWQ